MIQQSDFRESCVLFFSILLRSFYDGVHGLRKCGPSYEWLAITSGIRTGSIWARGKYEDCHVWSVGGCFLLSKSRYAGMNQASEIAAVCIYDIDGKQDSGDRRLHGHDCRATVFLGQVRYSLFPSLRYDRSNL